MRQPETEASLGPQQKRSHRLIDGAVAVTWVGIAVAMAFLGYAIHDANQIAIQKERTLVANGLKVARDDMRTNLKSITIWDEAVEKINNRPDHDFINDNVGTWFANYIKFPISMVLDGRNRVTYYYADGKEQHPSGAASWTSEIADRVAKLRLAEKKGGYAPIKAQHAYQPRMDVNFVKTGDTVALVGISSIVPDFGKVLPKPGPSALIVTVLPVTNGLLQSISRATLLHDMRYSPTVPTDGRPYVPISSGDGDMDGMVEWDPALPGMVILSTVWRPCIAILAILIAASLVSYQATRRMTDEILGSQATAIHTARHDALTGLSNREWFTERLKAELDQVKGSRGAALVFLDLDRLKDINDSMGYSAGDEVLIQVSERLVRLVKDRGFVARLSGDEFAIYLQRASAEQTAAFADELTTMLQEPFELVGVKTRASPSIGIVVIDASMTDDTEIMRCADVALNKAKTVRRGTIVYYEPELDRSVLIQSQLARDIRVGLEADHFHLVYQPLLNAKTMRASGVEALIRWNHPTRGKISPGIFIPIAERSGLIREVSILVMRRAFSDSTHWDGLTLAVNISPIHMKHPEFFNDIQAALDASGANPRHICLEITEGVLLDNSETMRRQLSELKQLGFKIVLDDFGTGYSSLSYLHQYNFDRIKIDKSFIQGLDGVMQSPAIVQAVIALSHMSGADVVAEGVETPEQYEFLKEAGCDLIQGFYFFEPLPLTDLLELTQGKSARDVA